MAGGNDRKRKKSSPSSSSSSSSSGDDESGSPAIRRKSGRRSERRRDRHKRESRKHRSEKGLDEIKVRDDGSRKRRRRDGDKEDEERRRRRGSRHRSEKKEKMRKKEKRARSGSSSDSSQGIPTSSGRLSEQNQQQPQEIVRDILDEFPEVAAELEQLLGAIDSGQGVDLSDISNKHLAKLLRKLFRSLGLVENDKGAFFLSSKTSTCLGAVGSKLSKSGGGAPAALGGGADCSVSGSKRLIGPQMPSRELLDAAAKLTEAGAAIHEDGIELDGDLFIGPPPPAVVAEAASSNEAERFEEVARITAHDVVEPYDVLGVNWKMPFDNIKKKYWKLSLMVHPDKCAHPQAHQAFVKLNQAFKDLQDPDKKKSIDEKIERKEQLEAMEVELRELREAAKWRKSQGISIEGDEELLALSTEPPKREEWMTTLPPERKPGMTMQSSSFSRTGKQGRGDTSSWTDNPLSREEDKVKMNYLEAYEKAKEIADMDERRKSSDAKALDEYNSSKRSISLVQKYQEGVKHARRKSKQPDKEEWAGEHPWKPWDREKDLSAGRKKVNFDSENMSQGLSTRFSSGTIQRNFL